MCHAGTVRCHCVIDRRCHTHHCAKLIFFSHHCTCADWFISFWSVGFKPDQTLLDSCSNHGIHESPTEVQHSRWGRKGKYKLGGNANQSSRWTPVEWRAYRSDANTLKDRWRLNLMQARLISTASLSDWYLVQQIERAQIKSHAINTSCFFCLFPLPIPQHARMPRYGTPQWVEVNCGWRLSAEDSMSRRLCFCCAEWKPQYDMLTEPL